jgi:hypothetical protein
MRGKIVEAVLLLIVCGYGATVVVSAQNKKVTNVSSNVIPMSQGNAPAQIIAPQQVTKTEVKTELGCADGYSLMALTSYPPQTTSGSLWVTSGISWYTPSYPVCVDSKFMESLFLKGSTQGVAPIPASKK